MADLLFSLNAVAPLFLVMLLGFVLKQRGFIDDAFVDTGTKVCFNVALPCLLFLNIAQSDLTEAFDAPLTILCVCGTLGAVVLLRLITPCFVKDVHAYSAFIQTSFRSNYVLLGLPFINNLVGQTGLTKASTVLAFMIPTFNVLAVLVLAENQGAGQGRQMLFKRIVTNPLIIAAVLGIIASLASFGLPLLLLRPLAYISDMAMPLALFTIGGSIHFQGEREKLRLALSSALFKLVLLPLATVIIALSLRFDPVQLSVVLALFAGPPAVSCFPMAFQMGADYNLTSLSIVLSTALAALTMFLFVYVLRVMGYV